MLVEDVNEILYTVNDDDVTALLVDHIASSVLADLLMAESALGHQLSFKRGPLRPHDRDFRVSAYLTKRTSLKTPGYRPFV
jgi:hypothetical protein